ncbi:MAG: hypothetical protein HQM09_07875 [Candidatus Riflebacteria bacterium]|nr:hypothetical protein [Candidatus Riflebacteria bacterium]
MKRCITSSLVFLAVFVIVSVRSFSEEVDWGAILAQNPLNQTALYAMAKKLNVSPELVQTKLLANALIKDLPGTLASDKSFYRLIACLEAVGEFENARKTLSTYIANHPKLLGPVIAMAYDYYLAGDFRKAIDWYDKGIALAPRDLDGYHGKMLSLIALREYDQALNIGKHILSVSPKNYFAALRIGNIKYELKDFQAALKYYSMLPDKIDFQLGMGLCYFQLRNYILAAPLLKAAVIGYPRNPELLSTLKYLNSLEIDSILKVLSSSKDMEIQQAIGLNKRLAELYELNGEYCKAADLLLKLASRTPQFKELVRIAADYYSAGKYQDAGTSYLNAVRVSPDPLTTSLAAADSFLLAGNASQAREILLVHLEEKNPVKELWPLFGRLYFQMNDKARGMKYFNLLGAEAERVADKTDDPRPSFMYAIDCYLNAGNYSKAKEILDLINSFAPGLDLDRKYIRYYSEQKNFSTVIPLCSKFPADSFIQNSKGWAYIGLGDIRNAEKTFRNVMTLYPENEGAKAGLKYTDQHLPWELFLGYTSIGYGGYQDDRGLVTESLRYSYRKATTTFSHSRTDVKSLSAGATDFNEDLYGAKLYYQASQKLGVQLHGMKFRNDDAETDGSSIFGGKFFCYPEQNWVIGAGFDSSNYNTHNGTQLSPFAGYQFNRFFRADAKGIFTHSGGSAMRASQSSTSNGGLVKATYTPDDRFTLSLGGLWGERRQGVDGDSLYAYNTLDLYKHGVFAKVLYNSSKRWKLYLSYSVDRFDSEGRAAANEKAGVLLSEPSQTSKTITAGGMYQF